MLFSIATDCAISLAAGLVDALDYERGVESNHSRGIVGGLSEDCRSIVHPLVHFPVTRNP